MFILGAQESFIRTRAAGERATAEKQEQEWKRGETVRVTIRSEHTHGTCLGGQRGRGGWEQQEPLIQKVSSRLGKGWSVHSQMPPNCPMAATPARAGSSPNAGEWGAALAAAVTSAGRSLLLLVHLLGDGGLARRDARKRGVLDAEHTVQHILHCNGL